MAVQLNHTIIPVPDKKASAVFLTEILGLGPPKPVGPFMCVETANGVASTTTTVGVRFQAITLSSSQRRSSTRSSAE